MPNEGDFVRLESSDSLDAALAKIKVAHDDDNTNKLFYELKGEPSLFLTHYSKIVNSISELLLKTRDTRKWISVCVRYQLEFPFEELEEHRERVAVIAKGFQELELLVSGPLGLKASVHPPQRGRGQNQCSEYGVFSLETPRGVPRDTLCFGSIPPEDAIVKLEEVWEKDNLNVVDVEMDLIYSREFMDCLEDIMADYFPQKRFRRVIFHFNNYDYYGGKDNETTKRLIDQWLDRVAKRVGVEAKTLHSANDISGGLGCNWNQDFTEQITEICVMVGYCFDGTNHQSRPR